MSHLEDLIAEYYDWQGYLVKRNVKVGKRPAGGWEMELDIVAYHPHKKHLVHLEPSLDAHSWELREQRYSKKFSSGEKYIFSQVFTWLPQDTPIEQIAVFPNRPKSRTTIAGTAKVVSMDELMSTIRTEVFALGIVAKNAIPEQYSLLRTLQLSHNGYYKPIQSL